MNTDTEGSLFRPSRFVSKPIGRHFQGKKLRETFLRRFDSPFVKLRALICVHRNEPNVGVCVCSIRTPNSRTDLKKF